MAGSMSAKGPTMRRRIPVLFLLLFLGLAPEAVVATEPETVTIPFNPPVGEDIRYRSERVTVRAQPGQPAIETRITNNPTFRFARGPGDGWTLTVTPGADEISGNAPEPVLAAARAVATAGPPLPMEVRLDRQGTFLDLANAESLMAELSAAAGRLRAAPPEGLPAEAVDAIFASLTGLSRDAFVEQAFATFRFAFEGAVEDLPLETPLPVRERMPVATLGGAEAEFVMTVTATRLSPGRVRMTVAGSVDAAALAPQIEAITMRLLETQPRWRELPEADRAKQRAELTEALRQTEQAFDTRVDVDLQTGLPVAAMQVRRTRAPSPSGAVERTDTLSLTRPD
jgi:hypothetical protein